MEHRKDNCIDFDEDLANIYDETRPFLSSGGLSKVLISLCQRLVERFPNVPEIEMAEIGAGTGRLTLAIAKHYQELASKEPSKTFPKLKITCIERANAMHSKIQEKANRFSWKNVQILPESPQDARDFCKPKHFHAVLAHWVFHVMADWRIAVFNIDKILKENGFVFLFREQSDLYRAIDDDLRTIPPNTPVLRLWQSFHEKRKSINKTLSKEVSFVSPRFRLGTRVIDERIEIMFSALGWSEKTLLEGPDSWENEFSIEDTIEKIIKMRAFTNMRLYLDQDKARKAFFQLAKDLKGEFDQALLKSSWLNKTEFQGWALCKPSGKEKEFNSTGILIEVAHDTLGRHWKRQLDHTYNKIALWSRLFNETWFRLNNSNGVTKPLEGLSGSVSASTIGIFAVAPFAKEKVLLNPDCGEKEKKIWCSSDKLWECLVGNVDANDPLLILFEDPPAKEGKKETLVSQFPTIKITNEVKAQLAAIPGLCEYGFNPQGPLFNQALTLRGKEPFFSCIENAKRFGGLAFPSEKVEAEFLISIGKLGSIDCLAGLYIFPFKGGLHRNDKTMGLFVGVKKVLDKGVENFLWSLSDVIFNEFLEDEFFYPGGKTNTQVTQPNKIKPSSLTPGDPQKWGAAKAPLVLIITAAEVEWKALIRLAGLEGKNLSGYRRGVFGQVYLDLGFQKFPVWGIRCGAGSTSPGASLTTALKALTTLKPKPFAVIMPGIAFGLKRDKQNFGDILLSEQIRIYDLQKRIPLKAIPRGDRPHCSPFLLRHFQQCHTDWQVKVSNKPRLYSGLIMSGEKLVNDPNFVEELLSLEEEAIGGEMEAVGIYSAAQEEMTHWIVVKSICDWGMGKVDDFQEAAALNSVDFVFHALNQDAFLDAIKYELSPLSSVFSIQPAK